MWLILVCELYGQVEMVCFEVQGYFVVLFVGWYQLGQGIEYDSQQQDYQLSGYKEWIFEKWLRYLF